MFKQYNTKRATSFSNFVSVEKYKKGIVILKRNKNKTKNGLPFNM